MALNAGVIAVTVEFARGLKDHDWFGKQDPYVLVSCAGWQQRSKTAFEGGRNPVWNQTFRFNIQSDNDVDILIKDEDTLTRDDVIGTAKVNLARCRAQGLDHVEAPVLSAKSKKQRGIISIDLKWTPHHAAQPTQAPAAVPPATSAATHPLPQPAASYSMPPAATGPPPNVAMKPSTSYATPPAGYPAQASRPSPRPLASSTNLPASYPTQGLQPVTKPTAPYGAQTAGYTTQPPSPYLAPQPALTYGVPPAGFSTKPIVQQQYPQILPYQSTVQPHW